MNALTSAKKITKAIALKNGHALKNWWKVFYPATSKMLHFSICQLCKTEFTLMQTLPSNAVDLAFVNALSEKPCNGHESQDFPIFYNQQILQVAYSIEKIVAPNPASNAAWRLIVGLYCGHNAAKRSQKAIAEFHAFHHTSRGALHQAQAMVENLQTNPASFVPQYFDENLVAKGCTDLSCDHSGLSFFAALNCKKGQKLYLRKTLYHDGELAQNVKEFVVTGQVRTWKKSPGRIEIPILSKACRNHRVIITEDILNNYCWLESTANNCPMVLP